jgi:hypothetical protein
MATTKLKCAKCGTDFEVHEPVMTQLLNSYMAQLTICPSWSIDERECPGCGAFYGPVMAEPKVQWVLAPKPDKKEEKRIIVPNLSVVPR